MDNNSSNSSNSPIENNSPKKRTFILWVLGILAMLDAGFSFLSYLGWAIRPDYMQQSLEMLRPMNILTSEQLEQVLNIYSSIQSWQYILLALVSAALFAGVFLMLVKLQAAGFHIYTMGKITEFCVLNFVIGGMAAMNINGIITSVLWVLMFATQIRYMEPFDNQDNNTVEKQITPNDNDNPQSHE